MTVPPAAHAAALWAGLNLILMLVLSVRVVRIRRTRRIGLGHAGNPDLERAVRAFGNASEYIPAALLGLGLLALLNAPAGLVHLLGLAFTLGRIAHAVGLSRSGGASLPRTVGVITTWLVYLTTAVILLVYAVP
ncbi:MAPEG family protein [Phenylobacterium sp. LjRoot225]|uniref:MAPEG family protein n=1 Tax=Phenylobacterium sp. LjRoot225 TaxID=3342285 RepID=UPI003ECF1C58